MESGTFFSTFFSRYRLALLLTLSLIGPSLGLPAGVAAKVYFYALSLDGELIKYDPETDQVVQRKSKAGQHYIDRRNIDSNKFEPTRVLDITRGRIVTFTHTTDPGVVTLDLAAGTATEIRVSPPENVVQLGHLVYPRQNSRFYVHWIRQLGSTGPREVVLTAVDFAGEILGTTPSPIPHLFGGVLSHLDGRSFYALDQPNALLRLDGETLAVRESHNLGAFFSSGATGQGISDVRDGRVLLAEGTGTGPGLLDPQIVFTVDLANRTTSLRIAAGLGTSDERLSPGAGLIVLQEARTATDRAGTGRLHVYDVTTGNKLGVVSFRADMGAVLLGFHPDGRRLFLRARNRGASLVEPQAHLVIVDVVSRTVLRDRPFDDIGYAVDFVDEP